MAKYSRYGSYFLAVEKDDEIPGELNISAKPINRKRHDFVNDTDPENFADNLSDDDLPEDLEDAPEGFPMGDIEDFPDDGITGDDMEPFPGEDVSSDNDMPDFPDDEIPEDFPTDDIEDFPDEDKNSIDDFPDDVGGEPGENTLPDDVGNPSSDNVPDGQELLDEIIKNKTGGKLPTPDEIIDDLRKQVYGENPPDATQTNNNNSGISDFPTDNTQNADITGTDTQTQDINNFPGTEPNPMNNTPDANMDPFPGTDATATPDMTQPATEPFPGDMNANPATPGTTNITAAPDAGGMDGFPTDTDFGATGGGLPGTDMGAGTMGATGAPMAPPGPGVGYDSMRKYNLYKEYNRLLKAIANYISKLENLMFDEPHQNLVVKTVTDKLNEVKKLCYDYLTMKFELASYAQAYVFFEELTVSIQVIFTILMTISSYNTDQDDKKKKKNKTIKKDTKSKK